MYIEYVYRTALPVGIQFPRRSIGSRGIGRGVPLPPNAGNGAARPRWCLWRCPLSSGDEEARPEGTYRCGDHFPAALWVIDTKCVPRSRAVRFARGISEPLPADHPHEVACAKISGFAALPGKAYSM